MPSNISAHTIPASADILELLKRDHLRVDELLDRIEETDEADERRRAQLFAQVAAELEVHADAEDQIVYSALESRAGCEDWVDDARQEHEHIEQMVEELELVEPSSPEWIGKVRELRQLFRHHIDDEETAMFARIRQELDAAERARMAGDFVAAKESEEEDLSGEREMPLPAEPPPPVRMEMTSEIGEAIDTLSKKELYELARSRHIEGRSAMTKAELVDAIRAK